MTGRIVCVGNIVLDQVFEVEAMPQAGIKTTALGFRESGGGPAATAALAIAKLGGQASWLGRTGDDMAGATLREYLTRHGVDIAGVTIVPGGRTVRAAVIVSRTGDRSIIVDRTGLPTDPELLQELDLANAAAMLVDTRWPDGSEEALRRAQAWPIPRVLDADGGDFRMLERLTALSDHIVFSEEGLHDLVGTSDPEDGLRRAAQRLTGVLAVTCGAAGSLWLIDGRITRVNAFKVTPRDTTGAGDVFHGAYALGLAEQMPPLKAARFASAVAAAKAERGMGWDGMPDRAAVDRMMIEETDR